MRRPVTGHTLVSWLAIGLAGLLVGCQTGPPEPKGAVREMPDPVTQAREAMERDDYAEAATLLREALVLHPNDLEAHYRLAVSASYLHLTNEAIREFQWVMAQGPVDSPEVRAAREWLNLAGVLVERAPIEATRLPSEDNPPAGQPNLATVSGKVTWGEDGSVVPMVRLQLFLKGVADGPVRDEYHVIRTDQDGTYRFTNVVPGEYMLTNRIAGSSIWRLRVRVEPGQHLPLDLTPQNSVKTRDDFPDGSSVSVSAQEPGPAQPAPPGSVAARPSMSWSSDSWTGYLGGPVRRAFELSRLLQILRAAPGRGMMP